MARGLCILLLVVVSAVAVDGLFFHRFHRRYYRRYHHHRHALHLLGRHSLWSKYHGFHIDSHRHFLYHGIDYKLGCGKLRFWRLWRRCYGRYHTTAFCLNRFLHKHWITKVGLHGHLLNPLGHTHGYLSLYNKYHGFPLHNNVFHYGGLAYRLSVSKENFYRAWVNCVIRLKSAPFCFAYLQKQHLYSIYHGLHGHGYLSLYNKYHGFPLHNNIFNYGGLAYRLLVNKDNFYRAWVNCMIKLKSAPFCVSYLRNKHLYSIYQGGHALTGGHAFTYNDYFNVYHGFPLHGNVFSYNNIDYRLTCPRNRFFRLWSECYKTLGNVGLCFQRLQNQHLFSIYNNAGGVITYNDYFNTYHGFSLDGDIFRYRDIAYKLSCQRKTFFRLWSKCYKQFGDVGLCFQRLHNEHLFSLYNNAGGVITYNDYFNKYHGFPLHGDIFRYRDIAYKLSCQRKTFFRLWSKCYQKFGDAGLCFQRLHDEHLFSLYNNALSSDDETAKDPQRTSSSSAKTSDADDDDDERKSNSDDGNNDETRSYLDDGDDETDE